LTAWDLNCLFYTLDTEDGQDEYIQVDTLVNKIKEIKIANKPKKSKKSKKSLDASKDQSLKPKATVAFEEESDGGD